LTLAQIYYEKGNLHETIKILEGIDELKNSLPMVSTLVSLYEKLNNIKGASKVLDTALNDMPKDSELYIKLLQKDAEFKLKLKDFEGAAEIYSNLLKVRPNDIEVICRLVIASSHFNPKISITYEKMIPPVNSNENYDVDELEEFKMPEAKEETKLTSTIVTPNEIPPAGKKKKKRINKPPKDTTKPIDPERWIPLEKRSYYKGRKKKNQQPKKYSRTSPN